jgi:hypothetical protein
MKRVALLLALCLVPSATASDHLPLIRDLRVHAGDQVLLIEWAPADDSAVVGYVVRVWAEGRLVQTLNATEPRARFLGAVNERPYAVQVAARDANGDTGPFSPPVAAVPRMDRDQTYLALGLIVVWVGLWAYAVLLTRVERNLVNERGRIRREKERLGEQK